MWIMISGPYRHGSKDPQVWEQNLNLMNEFAYAVFKLGHMPIIGVNMAKPIIDSMGEGKYEEIMMPLSLSLIDRCDAVLRVGGESKGADDEVERFRKKGLPIYDALSQIPII